MAGAQGIRAGRAYVELGTADRLTAGLNKAARQLDQFAAGIRTLGTRIAAVGLAATGGLFAAAKSFADYGDALDEASQRTGIAVADLSRLQYAAGLAGASMGDLETAIKFLQKGGGTGSLDELREIADQMNAMTDPGERARLALEKFGRSGVAMIPMLAGGSRALDQIMERADLMGATMSGDAVAGAVKLADTLDELKASLSGLVRTVGSTVAPVITKAVQWLTAAAITVGDIVRRNADLVVGLLKTATVIVAVGSAAIALSLGITAVSAALKVVAGSIRVVTATSAALFNVLGKSPAGLALKVAAVAAGVFGAAAVVAEGVDSATAALEGLEAQFAETLKKVQGGMTMPALKAGNVPDLGDIARRVDIQQRTTGAWGGQNIERMIGGGNAAQRTAEATQETARNTSKLLNEVRKQYMDLFF